LSNGSPFVLIIERPTYYWVVTCPKKILLEQGLPQGDVISPYIFIVAVEILLIKITYTRNLTGITFGCVEGSSETFADDTTIYIERTPENLRSAV
jgi:hypothetical protein